MLATLRFPEELARFAGGLLQHDVRSDSVEESLREIVAAHRELESRLLDEHGHLQPHLAIILNGHLLSSDSLRQEPVRQGDTIEVFPLASGG